MPGLIEEKDEKMSRRTESSLTIITALLVLLSAMFDPLLSFGIAVMVLVALAVYKLLISHQHQTRHPK